MTATTRPPKPRKRAANAAGQNGAGQAFFFVDSDSSTREKRAHVMRHHIQTKRKQHHLTTQSDRQSSRGPRYLPWRKKSDSDATSSGEQDDGPVRCSSPLLAGFQVHGLSANASWHHTGTQSIQVSLLSILEFEHGRSRDPVECVSKGPF